MTPARTVTRRAGRYLPPGLRRGGGCPQNRAPAGGGEGRRKLGRRAALPVPWGSTGPPEGGGWSRGAAGRAPAPGSPGPRGARRHGRAVGGRGPHFLVRRQRRPPPCRAQPHAGWRRGAAGGRAAAARGRADDSSALPAWGGAARASEPGGGLGPPASPRGLSGRRTPGARREPRGRDGGKLRRPLCVCPAPRLRRAQRGCPEAPQPPHGGRPHPAGGEHGRHHRAAALGEGGGARRGEPSRSGG